MRTDIVLSQVRGANPPATFDIGGVLVGLYWAVFTVKSIIFHDVIISGLFYPFYLGLLLVIAVRFIGGHLQVEPLPFWATAIFLTLVAASFLGFEQPIDQGVIQGIIVLLVSPVVFMCIRSPSGLRVTLSLALLAGLAIAIWTIINSAQGGFRYRGDVDINQNVVAFTVGLSLMVAFALFIAPRRKPGRAFVLGLTLAIGAMGYALLLLASRGMTIAFVGAIVLTLAWVTAWHKRALLTSLLVLALLAATLLLPGGTGLFERFEAESVDSAGDRIPIWRAVIEDASEANVLELAFGHGFRSSRPVVRSATGVLESTHNAYVAVLYEYGFIGLGAFLALHGAVLALAFRKRQLFSIVAVGLVWFLLFANMSSTDHEDFMYWVAFGVAVACASLGRIVTKSSAESVTLLESP